jgi:hypothetical protein
VCKLVICRKIICPLLCVTGQTCRPRHVRSLSNTTDFVHFVVKSLNSVNCGLNWKEMTLNAKKIKYDLPDVFRSICCAIRHIQSCSKKMQRQQLVILVRAKESNKVCKGFTC